MQSRFLTSTLPGIVVSLFILLFFISIIFSFLQVSDNPLRLIDPYIIHLINFTFFQALLSTLLSLTFGIFLAWSLSHLRSFYFKELLLSLFSSSLVLPSIIVILGIITVFGTNGWLNHLLSIFGYNLGGFIYGLDGILFAHVFFNASYAASVLINSFESIPMERYKLAKSLNLTVGKRFLYVEFPQTKSSLPGIATVIFLLCFSSFAIVLILGGSPKYNTIEVAIYEALKFDFDLPRAVGLSFIQIFFSSLLLLFASKFGKTTDTKPQNNLNTPWLESKREIAYHIFTVVLFSFFFILPLLAIFYNGIGANFLKIFKERYFITSLTTSLAIASISSLLTLTATILLSFARANLSVRYQRKLFATVFDRIIALSGSIYLALPPMVLGVGFFILANSFSLNLESISYIAIIFANILLALPFCINALYPIVKRVLKNYNKLMLSLNIKRFSMIRYVYLPHLKSTLLYIFAISFCFSLGDLSIIALFGNQDITTLPWYIYQKMGSYRSYDAAGGAVVLLSIIIAVFALSKKVKNVRS